MIICKACECKQDPTPRCAACGISLFPLGTLPHGDRHGHPRVVAMLPFLFVPDELEMLGL